MTTVRHKAWFKPGSQTQLAITFNCLHAFFLFGYDQGLFGGLMTNEHFLKTMNHPSETLLGFIASSFNLGCLSGCIINFGISSRMGRRHTLWLAMIILSAGAVLQAAANGQAMMIVGRIITGVGIGLDTSTVPIYQAELCKSDRRGSLVTTEILFTALGIAVSYFFAFGMDFVGGEIAWRLPISIQIPPAIIICIVLFGLPETPRWLMARGEVDEAIAVMCQVYNEDANSEYIVNEKKAILDALELESQNEFRWMHIFKPDPVQTGKRVLLGCLAQFFNQWSGINVVVFYIATVMEVSVGLPRNMALVAAGCINLAFAVGSLVPALYLDRIGRRKPMYIGAVGMGFSLMLITILLSFKGKPQEKVTATTSIAFYVTYMLFFGASLNAIPWCYATEIMPLKARAKGTSVAVMTNWTFVFIIVMIAPIMIANLTWKTWIVFMSTNFAIAPVIYFFFPETSGLSLEEIDYIFIKTDHIPESHGKLSANLEKAEASEGSDGQTKHIE